MQLRSWGILQAGPILIRPNQPATGLLGGSYVCILCTWTTAQSNKLFFPTSTAVAKIDYISLPTKFHHQPVSLTVFNNAHLLISLIPTSLRVGTQISRTISQRFPKSLYFKKRNTTHSPRWLPDNSVWDATHQHPLTSSWPTLKLRPHLGRHHQHLHREATQTQTGGAGLAGEEAGEHITELLAMEVERKRRHQAAVSTQQRLRIRAQLLARGSLARWSQGLQTQGAEGREGVEDEEVGEEAGEVRLLKGLKLPLAEHLVAISLLQWIKTPHHPSAPTLLPSFQASPCRQERGDRPGRKSRMRRSHVKGEPPNPRPQI